MTNFREHTEIIMQKTQGLTLQPGEAPRRQLILEGSYGFQGGGRKKLFLKFKKAAITTRPFRYDLNQIPYDFTVEVK